MKKRITLLFGALLILGMASSAQKVKILQGKPTVLNGESSVNIEYDYSNMRVGKMTEEEYIEEKSADAEKKKPGNGDKWKSGWVNARKDRYEPKFEELFVKSNGNKIEIAPDSDPQKYTLIVKTTFTEPGWNIGISKKPAAANFEFIIVETANKENIVCKMEMKNVPGSNFTGADYDVGSRVQECYAKAGKSFGKYLAKAVK